MISCTNNGKELKRLFVESNPALPMEGLSRVFSFFYFVEFLSLGHLNVTWAMGNYNGLI